MVGVEHMYVRVEKEDLNFAVKLHHRHHGHRPNKHSILRRRLHFTSMGIGFFHQTNICVGPIVTYIHVSDCTC